MSEMHDKVRALGTDFTPEQIGGSIALFTPLLHRYDEATVVRDIAYGSDARHRLDLFGVGERGAMRPIVIFIHGGGFIRGDKGGPADPFYSNVGAWAAAQGWLGCTATYRLAPDHPWPAGAQDMAEIVTWVRANAETYGGDPEKIVLIGQSAGAAHVASYVGCAGYAETAAESLAGAVFMSGFYDLVNAKHHSPYETAYYGSDATRFTEQSSIGGLARTTVPCLFTVSENDPEPFQRQAALAIAAWVEAKGKWPDFHILEAQNHISPVHQIGGSADEVGPLLKHFIERVTR